MKVYISGPMTGMERHGFPAFFEAEESLRLSGYEPVSPARLSIDRVAEEATAQGIIAPAYEGNEDWYEERFAEIPRWVFLRQDTEAVLASDSVATLPGWTRSEGARYEVEVARQVGVPVYCQHMRRMGGPRDLAARPLDDGCEVDWPIDVEETTNAARDFAGIFKPSSERVTYGSGAMKADGGKPRMDLLSYRANLATAEVMTFGAEKYDAHNWRKGFPWSRIYSSLQRHLGAWNDGEDLDPETNLSHLAHARCNLDFLLEFEATGTGEDDRYKPSFDVAAQRERFLERYKQSED